MKFSILRLAILCATVSAGAQGPARKYPSVIVDRSELRTIKSAIAGREYDIQVLLPNNFERDTQKKYPLLLVLDGQWDFKLMASVQGGLFYDKYTPDVLVVGITYPGENPNYDALRAYDLTPVANANNTNGGGAKFLAFIESELLPFLESSYRADPQQRYLQGNSLGGMFTLYAAFTKPQLFKGYIASSPAVTAGNRNSFTVEAAYAASHTELPGRMFIGVGEMEQLAGPVKEFIDVLKKRNYSGLALETEIVSQERHSGNKPETYNRGLRFVFGGHP
jgi:predicted alpha/beta superfamily hydrolase